MNQPEWLLVDRQILPQVFQKVLQAKAMLANGEAESAADACRRAGLSRGTFYKYKDSIRLYEPHQGVRTVTFSLRLSDEPGVLAGLLQLLCGFRANILTVQQNAPVDRAAAVTVTFRIDRSENLDVLQSAIEAAPGVLRASRI